MHADPITSIQRVVHMNYNLGRSQTIDPLLLGLYILIVTFINRYSF